MTDCWCLVSGTIYYNVNRLELKNTSLSRHLIISENIFKMLVCLDTKYVGYTDSIHLQGAISLLIKSRLKNVIYFKIVFVLKTPPGGDLKSPIRAFEIELRLSHYQQGIKIGGEMS